jgi:ABC-2 type transport system ATP-binding protein
MELINIKNVSKVFEINPKRSDAIDTIKGLFSTRKDKVLAVDNINFEVSRGEVIGYIGPNGAGKSTTIKMLTGILSPSSGHIEIDGIIPYKNRKEYVKNIGVVFGQRSQLWWDLPVADSFSLLKDIYKVSDTAYSQNMELFYSELELESIINKPVRQLSLGQRMRCEIAASFIHNPKIVYLDEPTIGLDVVAKQSIRNIIKKLNAEKNNTIILTTHDMSDIEELCKRIIIIDKGKVVYDGELSSIKKLFNQNRILTIDFSEDTSIDIPKIKILDDCGKRKKLCFNVDEIPVQEVMSRIFETNNVVDLESTL